MVTLAQGMFAFPRTALLLPDSTAINRSDFVTVLGVVSDDGILAVAPQGLLYLDPIPTTTKWLAGTVLPAVARSEQELVTLRKFASTPLTFKLVSQE